MNRLRDQPVEVRLRQVLRAGQAILDAQHPAVLDAADALSDEELETMCHLLGKVAARLYQMIPNVHDPAVCREVQAAVVGVSYHLCCASAFEEA